MLMAVIGDVHGNWPALDSALRYIDDRGIQTVVNTGDSVVGHPYPNEVVETLRRVRMPSVQGEMDRYVARFQRSGQRLRAKLPEKELGLIRHTFETLRSDHIEYLGALPQRFAFTLEGLDVCVCHGSPSSSGLGLREDGDERRFQRERESANARIVACGMTHRPFSRFVADTLFVNPGSLGMATADRRAGIFAIINTEETPWAVDFPEVTWEANTIRRSEG